MAEVISTAASDRVISTVTTEHMLHSTTTTHTILANEQHGLTSTITSMVHTDAVTIQQAILTNLPHFIDLSKPKFNPASAHDGPIKTVTEPTSTEPTSIEPTATFAFVSLLTVDKTATGKPVKKLFSFDLQLDMVSSNELCTELAFATIPADHSASSHDDSTSPAIVEGTMILNPQSPDTTRVTLTAEIVCVPEVKSGTSGIASASSKVGPGFVGAALKTMRTGINSMESSSTPSAPSPQTGAAILDYIANAVLSLHTQYARYEQVDAAMYKKFEEEEVPNAPPIQPHENDLVNKSLLFGDDSKTSAKFKRIKVSLARSAFLSRPFSANTMRRPLLNSGRERSREASF